MRLLLPLLLPLTWAVENNNNNINRYNAIQPTNIINQEGPYTNNLLLNDRIPNAVENNPNTIRYQPYNPNMYTNNIINTNNNRGMGENPNDVASIGLVSGKIYYFMGNRYGTGDWKYTCEGAGMIDNRIGNNYARAQESNFAVEKGHTNCVPFNGKCQVKETNKGPEWQCFYESQFDKARSRVTNKYSLVRMDLVFRILGANGFKAPEELGDEEKEAMDQIEKQYKLNMEQIDEEEKLGLNTIFSN